MHVFVHEYIYNIRANCQGKKCHVWTKRSPELAIPQAIMMMDPTQVIRALDVFALMVNVDLLIAHLIGTGITLLLSRYASKARLEYIEIQ